MAMALSARDRRAVLRGMAVVLAALVYAFGIKPSRERRAQLLEQLEVERDVLVRERRLAADRAVPDSAVRANGVPRLFGGADAVMASAALAEYLTNEAERHEVWVQQAITAPPASTSSSPLEVRVRAESDLQGLLRWLAALERGPKWSRVSMLDVRALGNVDERGTSPLAISAVVQSVRDANGSAP